MMGDQFTKHLQTHLLDLLPPPLLPLLLPPAQSGLPSDPDNCDRMSVQNAVATYDSGAETVTISFDTSTKSTCVCKVPAIGKREKKCEYCFLDVAGSSAGQM